MIEPCLRIKQLHDGRKRISFVVEDAAVVETLRSSGDDEVSEEKEAATTMTASKKTLAV